LNKQETAGKLLFLAGSVATWVFGVLTAYSPGLALISRNYMLPGGNEFFTRPILVFGMHILTFNMLVVAVGSFLGVFCFFFTKRRYLVASLGILLCVWGFAWPAEQVPHETNVPGIGYIATLAAFSIMFLGFVIGNPRVPRWTLISVPLLPAVTSINSAAAMTNDLELFNYVQNNLAMWILLFLAIGYVLVIWGAAAAMKPAGKGNRKKGSGNPPNEY
jgi:hypothetical protein